MATSCAAISSTAMAGVDPTAALSAPLTIATSTPSGTPVVTPATVPVTSQLLGEGLAPLPQKLVKKRLMHSTSSGGCGVGFTSALTGS